MNELVCKKCGCNALEKINGVYECKECHAKYLSAEIERNIESSSSGSQLDTVYQLAENAIANKDYSNAIQHYQAALNIDPTEWKPLFYITYCKCMCSNANNTSQSASELANISEETLKRIKSKALSDNDLKITLLTIVKKVNAAAYTMGLVLMESRPEMNRLHEQYEKFIQIYNAGYVWGNSIVNIFGDYMGPIAAECWSFSATEQNRYINSLQQWLPQSDVQSGRNTVSQFTSAIRKYKADFSLPAPKQQQPSAQSSGGCYIATCVYGSYDCPKVWVLRRYRDTTLAATWYGRLFISLYYAISPTIVRVMGDSKVFKTVCVKKLDKMVKRLQNAGFEDTPYKDKKW